MMAGELAVRSQYPQCYCAVFIGLRQPDDRFYIFDAKTKKTISRWCQDVQAAWWSAAKMLPTRGVYEPHTHNPKSRQR